MVDRSNRFAASIFFKDHARQLKILRAQVRRNRKVQGIADRVYEAVYDVFPSICGLGYRRVPQAMRVETAPEFVGRDSTLVTP